MPGYANLIRQNRLEPLNSFISSAGINTAQYNGVVEQVTVNGNIYELPFRMDFWLTFYNKDIFDKAGVPYPTNDMTLDQYEQLARRLTSGSGASKIYGGHYHTWASQVQNFGLLDGRNTLISNAYEFLTPFYQSALRQQDDGIIQAYSTLRTSGTHYSGVFFNSQIAMMHQGTWFIATQIDRVAKGEALSKNWGIANLPHPGGGNFPRVDYGRLGKPRHNKEGRCPGGREIPFQPRRRGSSGENRDHPRHDDPRSHQYHQLYGGLPHRRQQQGSA